MFDFCTYVIAIMFKFGLDLKTPFLLTKHKIIIILLCLIVLNKSLRKLKIVIHYILFMTNITRKIKCFYDELIYAYPYYSF